MTWALGLTLWAVLSFPIALITGPRLRSLTNDTPTDTSGRRGQHIRKEAA
jgi:hypothetical protein